MASQQFTLFEWPLQSPSHSPCDFYKWEWAKDEFYQSKPGAFDELKQTGDTSGAVLGFLRKTVESVCSRLQKSGQNAGAYINI
jgi:hypothetical protein